MGDGRRAAWWVVVGVVLVAVAGLVSSAAARSQATKRVSFHGYKVEVPTSWPVVDLTRDPSACVRFDVHAVYLGHPGANQSCPAGLRGRTEALLVEPIDRASRDRVRADTTWAPPGRAAVPAIPAPAGHEVTIAVRQAGVLVTGSYGDDRGTLERIVGGATLTQDARPAAELAPAASTAATVVQPGTFTGSGFDACTAPSSAAMATWLAASPHRAVGVYIGGVSRACAQPNLTPSWVSQQTSAGWTLIPTYVGLQAPCTRFTNRIDPANAPAQGRAAAEDAAVSAGSLGIGAGSTVYLDMEGYSAPDPATATACSQAVLDFLGGWSARLHELGYLSGVYSSANSGIRDLVAAYPDAGFVRPDHVWFARWDGVATVSDPAIPAADWPDHRRLKQYQGGHDETWPGETGVTINVDSDYLDVAAAPPPPPPVDDSAQDAPAVATVGTEIHALARGRDARLYEAVYRTTSGWSSWAPLGTLQVAGTPAVIRYSTGLNLYVRGADQRLYESYLRSGSSWSRWVAHAGLTVAGDPAAVTDGTGIEVFARGADHTLHETGFKPATRWSAWVSHAGVALAGNPAVVSLGSELHVFARGSDGTLYETFFQSGFGWSAWAPHAGRTVVGDPAAVRYGNAGINLYVRGADQRLYELYLRSSGWSSWVAHGGAALDGDPAALLSGTEIHVFARTTANLMAETFYRVGAGWSAWATHGGRTIAGTPAAVTYGSGGINAYARGADHHLWETYFRPSTGWSPWHVKGGTAVAIA